MKHIPFEKFTSYSEVQQTFPLLFKLVRVEKDICEELSGWFRCREFLNDVVYAYATGKTYTIYSFKVPDKLPNGFKLHEGSERDVFEENLELFEEACKMMGVSFSYENGLLLFDEDLFKHQFKISAFSLMIKILCQCTWTSLEKAVTTCTGNEGRIFTGYGVKPLDYLKSLKIIPKLKQQSEFISNDIHAVHATGVGSFLRPNINNKYNKDVRDALQSL